MLLEAFLLGVSTAFFILAVLIGISFIGAVSGTLFALWYEGSEVNLIDAIRIVMHNLDEILEPRSYYVDKYTDRGLEDRYMGLYV